MVRLTNSGSGALANLRLAVASPDVFCGAQSPDDGFATLRADPSPVESFRDGQALYALGPGARLAPGTSLRWPLWLHPRAAGELAFHYVWHYEPEEPVDGMRYRFVCSCRHWLLLSVWLTQQFLLSLTCCSMLECAVCTMTHLLQRRGRAVIPLQRFNPAHSNLRAGCCAWRTA